MVRLTDSPDMIVDAYRGRKTTIQQQQLEALWDLCWPAKLAGPGRNPAGDIIVFNYKWGSISHILYWDTKI